MTCDDFRGSFAGFGTGDEWWEVSEFLGQDGGFRPALDTDEDSRSMRLPSFTTPQSQVRREPGRSWGFGAELGSCGAGIVPCHSGTGSMVFLHPPEFETGQRPRPPGGPPDRSRPSG